MVGRFVVGEEEGEGGKGGKEGEIRVLMWDDLAGFADGALEF